MRLKNKVAIITGAGGGMGAETARLFAREGAAVVIADLFDEGDEVASFIRDGGGRAQFIHADVTKVDDWDRLVSTTMDQFGKLDILVNNAGLSNFGQTDPMSLEGWEQLMGVNADGPFFGVRAAIPAMIEAGGGSIVNISSVMAIVGSSGHPSYHASKGAVRSLTKAIAVTYGPKGIRANSVHPGVMPPMRAGGGGGEKVQAMRAGVAKMIPLRRLGTGSDFANGVLFLASDEASYITGAELVIDGGYVAQ
jgi:NAD(P)-dependent dehydrogenase (short-subunit alcohol dehydrogenase family)